MLDAKEVTTGHKEFDKQTTCLDWGNIYATTEYGVYIDPWETTSPQRAPGARQAAQVKIFLYMARHDQQLAARIAKYACNEADKRKNPVILCVFSHWGKNAKRIIHGYILLTDKKEIIGTWYSNTRRKSAAVIDWCATNIA